MNKIAALVVGTAVTLGVTLGVRSGDARAAGFQLQEQSASGLGVAYSGQAAAVHDASTVFWNPAGMSLIPGRQVAAALHYIVPSTKFGSAGPLPGGSTYNALGNGGQGGESAFVPALYGSWGITPRWSAGLAINAPFGLGTEWDSTWAGQFHAIKSELQTLNVNPSVAFRVNNMLSLGGGISYQQLKAELTNAVSPLVPGSTGKVDGDDWGWGYNLGALLDLQQGTRLGLTYRSTIKYTIEGDLTFSGIALPGQPVKADVKLPDTFSIGLSHQINPRLRALADYTWTGWDSIQNLTIQNQASGATITNTQLNFKNSWRVGAGLEYQINQPWLLRAGLAYDNTPVQDAFRTPRLPDGDRTWLAVGARYAPGSNWWLDVGYTYIWVKDVQSELRPAGPVPGALVGTYKANVQVLAAQVTFQF